MKCWREQERAPAAGTVKTFDYPVVGAPPPLSWEAFGRDPAGQAEPLIHAPGVEGREARSSPDGHEHSEELRRSFKSGRQSGIEEGRAAERTAAEARARALELQRMEQAARLVENFHAQQTRYFETVEGEVVKLALAIAARVLGRETQMDPLLLSGAVRVALGQLSSSTQARLMVPADEVDLWKETIASLPNLQVKPAVVAAEKMSPGECLLETELGCVDLGISSQLAEIERSLFEGHVPDRKVAELVAIREDMRE